MLGVDNDDFEVHYNRKQGLYTPYDDKRPEDEYYYQEMENVIIETTKEYDLRSEKNLLGFQCFGQIGKTKIPDNIRTTLGP